MFTKLKPIKVSYIIVFAILLLIYWRWWLHFPHVANDLHVTFQQDLAEQMGFPYTWGTRGAVGMGEYAVSILWSWPVHLIFGILGNLGFPHNLLNQISVIALIIIGTFGIKILLGHYKIRKWGKFAGIIFYLASTYILLIVDGGQLLIGLAYAWMPIAYLMVDKSINSDLKQKIVAGLSVAVLGFFDIRFVYILLLLLLLRFLYEFLFLQRSKWITWILAWVKSGAVVGIIMIGLNAYWIIPAVVARTPALPATYQRVSQATFLSFANLDTPYIYYSLTGMGMFLGK